MGVEQSNLPITLQQQLWQYLESNDSQGLINFLKTTQNSDGTQTVDLNQSNSNQKNFTPLQFAITKGFKHILVVLLANNADINWGEPSPLHLAVQQRDCDAVNLLLKKPHIDLWKTYKDSDGKEYYAIEYVCMDLPGEIEPFTFRRGSNKNLEKIEKILTAFAEKYLESDIRIPLNFLEKKHSLPKKHDTKAYDITRIYSESEVLTKWETMLKNSKKPSLFFWLGCLYYDTMHNENGTIFSNPKYQRAFDYFDKCITLSLENISHCELPHNRCFFETLKHAFFTFDDVGKKSLDNHIDKMNFASWKTFEAIDHAPLWVKLAAEKKPPADTPDPINFPHSCYFHAVKVKVSKNSKGDMLVSKTEKEAFETGFNKCLEYLNNKPLHDEENNKLAKILKLAFEEKKDFLSEKTKKSINEFLDKNNIDATATVDSTIDNTQSPELYPQLQTADTQPTTVVLPAPSTPITIESRNQRLWHLIEGNYPQNLIKFFNYLFLHPDVAKDFNLNEPNSGKNNYTALEYAAANGHEYLVNILLSQEATYGKALFLAVKNRHVEIVELLFKHDKTGALLLEKDENGNYPFDYACTDFPGEIEHSIISRSKNKNIEKIEKIIELIFTKHIIDNIPIPYNLHKKHYLSKKPTSNEYDVTRIIENQPIVQIRSKWVDLFKNAKKARLQHLMWFSDLCTGGVTDKNKKMLAKSNNKLAYDYDIGVAHLCFRDEETCFVNENKLHDKKILKILEILKGKVYVFESELGFKSPIDPKIKDETNFQYWQTYRNIDLPVFWLHLASQNRLQDTPESIKDFKYDCYMRATESVKEYPLIGSNSLPSFSDLDTEVLRESITSCLKHLQAYKVADKQEHYKLLVNFSKLSYEKLNLLRDYTLQNTIMEMLIDKAKQNNYLNYYLAKFYLKDKLKFNQYYKDIPQEYALKEYLRARFLITHSLEKEVDGKSVIMDMLERILYLPTDSVDLEELNEAKEYTMTILKEYKKDKIEPVKNKAEKIIDTIESLYQPPPFNPESESEDATDLETQAVTTQPVQKQNLQPKNYEFFQKPLHNQEDLENQAKTLQEDMLKNTNPHREKESTPMPNQEEKKTEQTAQKIESNIKLSKSSNLWQQNRQSKKPLPQNLQEEQQNLNNEEVELLKRLAELNNKKTAFNNKINQFRISENLKAFEKLPKVDVKKKFKEQYEEEKEERRKELTDKKFDKSLSIPDDSLEVSLRWHNKMN